jgi:predicted  nucleic acid-binding Zn-ribbon protein
VAGNEIEVVIKSTEQPAGFTATAKRVADLKTKMADLARQKIELSADTSKVSEELRQLRIKLKTATGDDKIRIQADISAATEKLAALRQRAAAIGRERATISLDTTAAQAQLKQLGAAAQTAERGVSPLHATLKRVGETAAGFLAANVVSRGVTAFTGFVGGATTAASDLGESVNAVSKIFGSSAAGILKWGKDNAASFGLSQSAFNSLATPLGAFLKNTGMGMEDVGQHTIDLTKRAADLASVFNTSVSDAMEAIQSGLKGEQDPLEKFGVSLSAAAVQAEAMRLGLVKTSVDQGKLAIAQTRAQLAQRAYTKAVKDHGAASDQAKRAQIGVATAQDALTKAAGGSTVALTKQQQTQAALSLIMNQTKDVAGDFSSTSDQLANSQRIAAAQSENLKAQLGQKLLPVTLMVTRAKLALVDVVANKILPAFLSFGGWVSRNRELLAALAIGIVAVLVPAFISWAVAAGAAAIATIAAAAPIIAIALLIAALALGIMQLVKHWTAFKNAAIGAAKAVWDWIKRNWPYLLGMLTGPFGLAAAWIYRHWDAVVSFFKGMPRKMANLGAGMWDWIKNAFKSAINAIIGWWDNLEFTAPTVHIPGTNLNVGGFTIGLPDIPYLARGGIVKARPGGTMVMAGEGGSDEAVVPLDRLGGEQRIVLEIHSGGGQFDALLVEAIRKAVRIRGAGNVQLALGSSR